MAGCKAPISKDGVTGYLGVSGGLDSRNSPLVLGVANRKGTNTNKHLKAFLQNLGKWDR